MAFWNQASAAYTGQPGITAGEVVEPGSLKDLMIAFVGKPKFDFNIDPYNEKNKSSWTVPEALRGENPDMKTRIDYLAIHADNALTSVILPIEETDKLTRQATRFIHTPTLAQPIAEQARVRTLDMRQITLRGEMEQSGLGLELPIDFMTTEFGQDMFRSQIAMLDISIRDTLSLQVLHTLLACYAPAEEFERFYQLEEGVTLFDTIQWEREKWDIIHLNPTPLQVLQTLLESRTQPYRPGLPNFDTFIMHEKTLMYTTQVVDAYITYSKGGQEAVDRLNAGPGAAAAARDLRGNDYYTVKTYDINGKGRFDQMIREAAIGEYYSAFSRFKGQHKGYMSTWRQIAIYDWNISNFRTLDLQWMLENCHRFDLKTGRLLSIDDPAVTKFTVDMDPRFKIDSLHYYVKEKNGTRRMVPIKFFGHMLAPYFNDDDVTELSQTSIANMKDLPEASKVTARFDELAQAIDHMEGHELDQFGQLYLWLLQRDNKSRGTGTHPGVGIRPIKTIQEFKPNIHGGMDLVVFDGNKANEKANFKAKNSTEDGVKEALTNALGGDFSTATLGEVSVGKTAILHPMYPNGSIEVDTVKNIVSIYPRRMLHHKYGLPPGFANWPGLLTIAAAYSSLKNNEKAFEAKYQINFSMSQQVYEYVQLHKKIVGHLKRQFPGAVSTDSAYCSSWWHKANAETIFFDMLVHRHRAPAFLYNSASGPNDVLGPPEFSGSGESGSKIAVSAPNMNTVVQHALGVSEPARAAVQSILTGFMDIQPVIRSTYQAVLQPEDAPAKRTLFGLTGVTTQARAKIASNLDATTSGIAVLDLTKALAANSTSISDVAGLALFDPSQAKLSAADGLAPGPQAGETFYRNLPPFARARFEKRQFIPTIPATANTPEVKAPTDTLVFPTPIAGKQFYVVRLNTPIGVAAVPKDSPEDRKRTAYNRVVNLLINGRPTIAAVPTDKAGVKAILEKETAYAAMLTVLSLVRQDDLQDLNKAYDEDMTAEEVDALSTRINSVWENVLVKAGADQIKQDGTSNINDILGSAIARPGAILSAFVAHVRDYLSGTKPAGENPYKTRSPAQLENAKKAFDELDRRAKAKEENILGLINKGLIKKPAAAGDPTDLGAQFRFNPHQYTRAPITLSPTQVKSSYAYMLNKDGDVRLIPAALPADPYFPDEIVTIGDLASYAEAIEKHERENSSETLKALPAAHKPQSKMSFLSDSAPVVNVKAHMDHHENGGVSAREAGIRGNGYGSKRPPATAFEDEVIGDLEGINPNAAQTSLGVSLSYMNNVDAAQGNVLGPVRAAGPRPSMNISSTKAMTFGSEDIEVDSTETEYDATVKAAQAEAEQIVGSSFDHQLAKDLVNFSMPGRWARAEVKQIDKIHGLAAKTFLLTPVTLWAFQAFISNNILFPMNFLLARDDIRFITRPIIWMVKGLETGRTRYGKTLFTWGEDGDIRKWKGKYTYYSECAVEVPENVVLVNDTHVDGYAGGLSTIAHVTSDVDPHRSEMLRKQASIYVFAEPYTQTQYQSTISITGRPEAFGRVLSELLDGDELMWVNVWFYRQLFGFRAPEDGEQDENDILFYSKNSTDRRNIFLSQGVTHYFEPGSDGKPGSMHAYREGQGHYPTHVWGPSFRKVVSGALTSFERVSYDGWGQV